jgi:dTMP kinase
MFIAVDGIDGAGKTTLVRQLCWILEEAGLEVIATKEPTSNSEWGRAVRAAAATGRLPLEEEIEYFHRDRLFHIQSVIAPALAAGKAVVTDRYVDSTLAFQSSGGEDADGLYGRLVPEITIPDVTFILDCPVEIGLRRIRRDRGSLTAYEKKQSLERAREIYRSRKGPNYEHLDGSGTPENTLRQAVHVLTVRCRGNGEFVARLMLAGKQQCAVRAV